MNWNVPVLIMGVFAAFGLPAASFLLPSCLPGYTKAFGAVFIWMGVGAFHLGMKRAPTSSAILRREAPQSTRRRM